MNLPKATYRIQFSASFTLRDLQKILPYLEELGVSTIYSSPIFQARKESTHGYDVVDPLIINSEIGELETFQQIGQWLQERNMTWLQDIVPNHMAFDGSNLWLRDVLELGTHSEFFDFFDIEWNYYENKQIMAPFLGDSLDGVLKRRELQLQFNEDGLWIAYFDHRYPISFRSYPWILEGTYLNDWKEKFLEFSGDLKEWKALKFSFLEELNNSGEFNSTIIQEVEKINKSEKKLREILDLQFFKLVHWKKTEKEINYRRFFTINDLICLQMEKPEVFEAYHKFTKELYDEGYIHALRLDHIDGLFAPTNYLQKLRNLFGPDTYIIVEKILEAEENLPENWPVQGSSGYDFLALVSHLFTVQENEKEFSSFYHDLEEGFSDYQHLIYQKKLFILKNRMRGELKNLWSLLLNLGLISIKEEEQKEAWEEALCYFLAAFPVYRIYPERFPLKNEEREIIENAYLKAHENKKGREHELKKLRAIFLGEAEKEEDRMLFFLQRSQQFTGPLAAKGVEDTAFYIYNRLVSHNEVGDSPENFGLSVEGFHQKMLQRKQNLPFSMNTTSTHDTKRGEDARMRLNVLSEIPAVWFEKIREWRGITKKIREGSEGPSLNEEYFIYQTLLAGKGFEEKEEEFITRTKEYLQKVLREAKVNSNWSEPNEEYEEQVEEFIEKAYKDSGFRKAFDPFQKKIAYYGAIKSLGQLVVKLTAPGIPDIYQGTELWDFSYVDPDNRKEVNYGKRKEILKKTRNWQTKENKKENIAFLLRNFSSGEIKMFTLILTLKIRSSQSEVFESGDYIPLDITAPFSQKFVAYARRERDNWFLIVVPVQVTSVFQEYNFAPKLNWQGAKVSLPKKAWRNWRNAITGEVLKTNDGLLLEDLFKDFPIALLENIKEQS